MYLRLVISKEFSTEEMGLSIYLGKSDWFLDFPVHHDHIEELISEVSSDEIRSKMMSEITKIIGYTPKDKEELNDIGDDMEDNIDYWIEGLLKVGRRELVSAIMEDLKDSGYKASIGAEN